MNPSGAENEASFENSLPCNINIPIALRKEMKE